MGFYFINTHSVHWPCQALASVLCKYLVWSLQNSYKAGIISYYPTETRGIERLSYLLRVTRGVWDGTGSQLQASGASGILCYPRCRGTQSGFQARGAM